MLGVICCTVRYISSFTAHSLKPTHSCPTNPLYSLKSLHLESPINTNKRGSESNKCLKNKQQAIVFAVFTDQWAFTVLSVPLNLTFTMEQPKSMKLSSQPQIADIPHLPCSGYTEAAPLVQD